MTEIDDYAEPILQLQTITKALERAILNGNKDKAMELSNHLVNASMRMQSWCFRNME